MIRLSPLRCCRVLPMQWAVGGRRAGAMPTARCATRYLDYRATLLTWTCRAAAPVGRRAQNCDWMRSCHALGRDDIIQIASTVMIAVPGAEPATVPSCGHARPRPVCPGYAPDAPDRPAPCNERRTGTGMVHQRQPGIIQPGWRLSQHLVSDAVTTMCLRVGACRSGLARHGAC